LEEAIKLGDLSENAEYHQAKDDQGWAAARVREIESKIENAKIIQRTTGKQVDIGSKLEIIDQDGRERTMEIVDQLSADPVNGKISNESPMGTALMSKKEGDKVEVQLPSGPKTYVIKKVL
jgi:transcription elongation factor GreA